MNVLSSMTRLLRTNSELRINRKKRVTMKIALVCFTENGICISEKIITVLEKTDNEIEVYTTQRLAEKYNKEAFGESIKQWVKVCFETCCALIFIGACGIAVRAIAPWIRSKANDPAVIVIDEKANFVISLLSGHIGGANKLTRSLADLLGAMPVITTASDINGKFAIDEWAADNNMFIPDTTQIKYITSALLKNESVGLQSIFSIEGILPNGIKLSAIEKYGICISYDKDEKPFEYTLNLIPKNIAVGIGCRKNTPQERIESAIKLALQNVNLPIEAITGLYSIDIKKDEIGIVSFSEKHSVQFETFTSQELNQVQCECEPSEFVKKITGSDNICQRAAFLGSKNEILIKEKTVYNGVTIALAQSYDKITFNTQ